MNTFIKISIIIIVITTAVLTWFTFFDKVEEVSVIPGNQNFDFPDSSGDGTTLLSMPLRDGGSVPVKDFINNPNTVHDPVNKHIYILSGYSGHCLPDGSCPTADSSASFLIEYNSNTALFSVLLLKEPLADSRRQAERFLMEVLGVSADDLCRVKHSVAVPYWVNEDNAGQELSFSFCTDAVAL